jgi:hypothetical protein
VCVCGRGWVGQRVVRSTATSQTCTAVEPGEDIPRSQHRLCPVLDWMTLITPPVASHYKLYSGPAHTSRQGGSEASVQYSTTQLTAPQTSNPFLLRTVTHNHGSELRALTTQQASKSRAAATQSNFSQRRLLLLVPGMQAASAKPLQSGGHSCGCTCSPGD